MTTIFSTITQFTKDGLVGQYLVTRTSDQGSQQRCVPDPPLVPFLDANVYFENEARGGRGRDWTSGGLTCGGRRTDRSGDCSPTSHQWEKGVVWISGS